jgi:hypothetical protein
MNSFRDSLAYWTTIIGTVVAFLGLLQSLTWLAGIGIFLIGGSVIAIAYGEHQRRLLRLANLRVEGRSVDSLNIANLRRRVSRHLLIQEALNTATIKGDDLFVFWKCSGYCRAQRESAMELSIDTDSNVPFADLRCFAYDLRHDPNRRHKIMPFLIGSDGNSKKVAVPFLQPLTRNEPFELELSWILPGCVKSGVEYYTSSLSFEQDHIAHYEVQLIFEDEPPEWVRIYECV